MVGDGFYPDWEAVYRDNVDRVYRLMFAKVGNRPDAEDLTAEVFLTALRPLRVSASAAEVRNPGAYLLVAWAPAVSADVRQGRQPSRCRGPDRGGVPDSAAATAASADALGRASVVLAELPEHYRRILQLRFLDSCSLREAAAAMGVSVAYAKVLQHRALRRAAQLLEAGR